MRLPFILLHGHVSPKEAKKGCFFLLERGDTLVWIAQVSTRSPDSIRTKDPLAHHHNLARPPSRTRSSCFLANHWCIFCCLQMVQHAHTHNTFVWFDLGGTERRPGESAFCSSAVHTQFIFPSLSAVESNHGCTQGVIAQATCWSYTTTTKFCSSGLAGSPGDVTATNSADEQICLCGLKLSRDIFVLCILFGLVGWTGVCRITMMHHHGRAAREAWLIAPRHDGRRQT